MVVLSVTEGEDKPLKYPDMVASSQILLISKIDLLPHIDFDVEELVSNARKINPEVKVLKVSARTGEGMEAWANFIRSARSLALTGREDLRRASLNLQSDWMLSRPVQATPPAFERS